MGISAFFFGTKVALFGKEWILRCLIRDCGSPPPCRSQVQTHSPTPATSCALGSAVDLGWFVGFWMMDPNVSQCPRARTTRAQKVRRACWGARSVSFPYGHPLGYGNGVRGGGGGGPNSSHCHPVGLPVMIWDRSVGWWLGMSHFTPLPSRKDSLCVLGSEHGMVGENVPFHPTAIKEGFPL